MYAEKSVPSDKLDKQQRKHELSLAPLFEV